MYPTFLALVLALIFMDAALLVDAGLYVRVLVFFFWVLFNGKIF